jgi:hypothetical protein
LAYDEINSYQIKIIKIILESINEMLMSSQDFLLNPIKLEQGYKSLLFAWINSIPR